MENGPKIEASPTHEELPDKKIYLDLDHWIAEATLHFPELYDAWEDDGSEEDKEAHRKLEEAMEKAGFAHGQEEE
jgi:hypothetical protein